MNAPRLADSSYWLLDLQPGRSKTNRRGGGGSLFAIAQRSSLIAVQFSTSTVLWYYTNKPSNRIQRN